MRLKTTLFGAAALAGCALGPQAFAQTASPPAAAAAPAPEGTLSEIVVTARRRAESLQDVPTSVIAFDQRALTQKSIATAFDVNKAVPGLSVSADSGNAALPQFSIRGRGQNYGAAAGSVETYFADVPLSAPFQIPTLPAQFFDLQSFQVLKGPQGTLFGRSTTGGAVVIVPQAPQDVFGGYARAQFGDFADKQFEGAINIPIVEDKVLLRVAGFDWQRNGYMKTSGGLPDDLTGRILPPQDYNNVNTKEARVSLLLRPIDNLTNTTILTYHYDKTRNSSGSGLSLIPLPGSTYDPVHQVYLDAGYYTRGTVTSVDLDKPATTVWAGINTTTFDLNSDLTIKNIFGYIHARGYTDDASDDDGSVATAIDLPSIARPRRNEQVTDELQLQGRSFDRHLTWVIGGLLDNTYEPGSFSDINITSTVLTGPGQFVTRVQQNRIKSKALYASATFKVTEKLNVSAGYRYSWDDVYSLQGQIPGASGVVTDPSELSTSFAKFGGATYNADFEYHPTIRTMVYGGYRRGYKRGGFNASVNIPGLASFAPETVDDFYAGLKDDFTVVGMPARFNVEGYYDRYRGQQVSNLSLANGVLIDPTTNVPRTRYVGADVDFVVDPTDWLNVSGSYSYIDAKNTNWPDTSVPGSTIDLAQNPVVFAPKNKYSVTARFHRELPNDAGEVALAPTVSHTDLLYTNPAAFVLPEGTANAFGLGQVNTAAHLGAFIPAYTTLDLRAEWNHALGSKIDLAINATNLTNKLYSLGNSGTLSFGFMGIAYGPPRMINVEATTHF